MVGFGSSLRMGRRTGWESAYLDYETLKLLLSQIEAVYEEREQHQRGAMGSSDGFFTSNGGGGGGGGGGVGIADSERNYNSNTETKDYRDELFLESDSDIAFASEVDLDDDDSDEDEGDIDVERALADDSFEYNYSGITVWEQQGLGQHHMHVDPYKHENTEPRGLSTTSVMGTMSNQKPHHRTPSAFSVTAYGTTTQGGMYASSSDENDDYNANDSDYYDKCAPWSTGRKKKKESQSSFKSKTSNNNSKKKKNHRGTKQNRPHRHHKKNTGSTPPDAFIVEKGNSGCENDDDDDDCGGGNNYYYYNFGGNDEGDNVGRSAIGGGLFGGGRTGNREKTAEANEGSSLLQDPPMTPTPKTANYATKPSTNIATGNFVSFPTPRKEPETDGYGYGSMIDFNINQNNNTPLESATGSSTGTPHATMKDNTAANKKDERKIRYERERRRARKQRRKRRLIHQRKEREKTVPPHIRIAHAKARAITERFLGLLRAEVEKVTLFAQARLGELADTAGSLRFLSSDESMAMTATSTGAYDYPLSDGGIHPSASSSSDEGTGGYHHNHKGGFPWSDSSSDEGGSKESGTGRLNLAKTFSSADGYSTHTDPRGNLTTTGSSSSAPFSNASSAKGRRGPGRPAFTETQEKFEATTRKIAHFQEIRRDRSIFQRNDYIVGEDLLLISAVDEADAFSAVGVELLHLLKYICVNLIAVRKICKKHDRLLMNRMLGGYYHRKRTTRSQEDTTLGGLIAHVAGDIYEAHPDLIGLVNNGKLIGVYDLKIQQLANSRTVKVVSSCLALALSEYEVSSLRADALAKLNPALKKGKRATAFSQDQGSSRYNCLKNTSQQHEETIALLQDHDLYVGSDDEHGAGPPSTTSGLSLSRLRYAVLSIAALREASRIKSNPFSSYLSRSTLAFTGQAIIGEGLDGCSRDTLDVLLSYNPDAALLLDTSAIYEGLKCGHWRKASIASVMTSSLAVALILPSSGQSPAPLKMSSRAVHEKKAIVSNAFGILPPKSEGIHSRSPLEGTGLPQSIFLRISRFTDLPPSILRANRLSLFLYNANYFISHPTSVTLVLDSDDSIAYSALIIGAPIFSAIIVAAIHCHILSGYTTSKQTNSENIALFRYLLIFSCLSAIVGNIVQVYGIENDSISLTILGRFLMGFAAAEIVHRQFVICFIPVCLIVAESARLMQLQVTGQIFGLLIGSLAGRLITTRSEFNLGFTTKNENNLGLGRKLLYKEENMDLPTSEPTAPLKQSQYIVNGSSSTVPVTFAPTTSQTKGIPTPSLSGNTTDNPSTAPVIVSLNKPTGKPTSIQTPSPSCNIETSIFIPSQSPSMSTTGDPPTLPTTKLTRQPQDISPSVLPREPSAALSVSYAPSSASSTFPTDSSEPNPSRSFFPSYTDIDNPTKSHVPNMFGNALVMETYEPSIRPSSLLDMVASGNAHNDPDINQVERLTAANWFMVLLWLIYLLYIVFGWKVDIAYNARKKETGGESTADFEGYANEEVDSSDSSTEETGLLFQKSSKLREISVEGNYKEVETLLPSESPSDSRKGAELRSPSRKRKRRFRTFTKRVRKLMLYSIAIPVSLVLIVCTVFAQDVLFSSCALITKCYFHWRGSVTGLFLALLSVMLLPMDYVCEQITRRYEERSTVKRSIFLLGLGLLVMVNWGSLFALIPNIQNLFKEDHSNRHHQYDWMLGVAQYSIGFIITFTALRSLGVASRSMLSKVSPPNLQNIVINLGTIVTFVSLFSQLFANLYIASIVLSQREINVDILNSLLMPILITTLVVYYLVRKHYFFLM